jgi:hypothetical protein
MKKEVNSRNIRISELEEEINSIETKLELQKNECTTLKAKLQARSAQAAPVANIAHTKGGKPGAVPAVAHDAWVAEAKEDFYGDLIGLAILSVKKEKNDKDEVRRIFECLATGKAGSKYNSISRA